MNKIKGSIGAKIIAWILLTVSGIVFVGTLVAAFAINDLGIYTKTKDTLLEERYDLVSDGYSAMVLSWMRNGDLEGLKKYFAGKNFNYGIIQAKNEEELKTLDLNDETVYEDRNFSGEVTLEDLDLFQCDLSDSTTIYFDDSGFGQYFVHFPENGYIKTVQYYVYDEANGIFYYYTTDGYYFPIENITLNLSVTMEDAEKNASMSGTLTFIYDAEENAYYAENQTEAESFVNFILENQVTSYVEERVEADAAVVMDTMITSEYQEIADILSQNHFVFNQFDDTPWSYSHWDVIGLSNGDDYSYTVPFSAFHRSGTSGIEQNYIVSGIGYEDLGDALRVYDGEYSEIPVSYYIVSFVNDELQEGDSWWTDDLYVRNWNLVEYGYAFQYSIYAIMVVSAILALITFIFLMVAAGHRKNTNEIVPNLLDKMPLELFLGGACILEIFFMLGSFTSLSSGSDLFYLVCTLVIVLCMAWIFLAVLLSLSVRVKLGKWWKNTIIYYMLRCLKHGLQFIEENASIFWKTIGIVGAISFLEMLVILSTNYSLGAELFFWLIEKIVILLVVMKAVAQMRKLKEAGEHIAEGNLQYQVDTKKMFPDFRRHGDNLNSLNIGLSKAVEEKMKSERFKTELITNVSHDIKTPLTSIINYVDLLEKEEIDNENAKEYLEVLDRQSARLKKLIEDLMEASKASTGNLSVDLEKLEAGVFMVQTVGEFEEKTMANHLELIIKKPEEPVYIMADGRHFWRVIDNLMNNICKYAQPETRVYINLEVENNEVKLTFRNTSKYSLNISSEELMERFVRGDSSRNTEGSGLGLSIARSLMELMNGTFELFVDGDLFKVVLTFKEIQ